MDEDLREALAKRRELSGDIRPTGAMEGDSSSPEQMVTDISLAFTQVQSLLIGANQALESRIPTAILYFVSQIQTVVKSCPQVVEKLRINGLNLSDEIGKLESEARNCASSSAGGSEPHTPVRALGAKPPADPISSDKTSSKSSDKTKKTTAAKTAPKAASKSSSGSQKTAPGAKKTISKTNSLPSGAVVDSGSGSDKATVTASGS